MKKPINLKINGKTIDDKLVITNCYWFIDRSGLPLEDFLNIIRKNNLEIDWKGYILTGIRLGNNINIFFSKIKAAIMDQEDNYKNKINEYLDRILLFIEE